jgi:glycosyltransferase involved in cell wall biosynthesis
MNADTSMLVGATVSVVVPTFRRPEILAETLRALTATDYPPHLLDVVVVDDAAEPATSRVVSAFEEYGRQISVAEKGRSRRRPQPRRAACDGPGSPVCRRRHRPAARFRPAPAQGFGTLCAVRRQRALGVLSRASRSSGPYSLRPVQARDRALGEDRIEKTRLEGPYLSRG